MAKKQFEIACKNVAPVWLRSVPKCAGLVRVFSPYITSPLVVESLAVADRKRAEVYTRFDLEAFAAGASSIQALEAILKAGHPLFDVPFLHAKVVIADGVVATVGSQNLTARGTKNREASVVVTDSSEIAALRANTEQWIADASPITAEMIADAKARLPILYRAMRRLQRECMEAQKAILAVEKRREEITAQYQADMQQAVLQEYWKELQSRLARLDGDRVSRDLCTNVLWRATEWLRKGEFARSRKDAWRMREGRWGYELPLGENRFLIEFGLKLVRDALSEMFQPGVPRDLCLTQDEILRLRYLLACCVAGHGERRFHSYPVDENWRMAFGSHYVNLRYTIDAILEFTGFGQR